MKQEQGLKTVTPAEDRVAERSEADRAGAGVTVRRPEVVVVADPEVPGRGRVPGLRTLRKCTSSPHPVLMPGTG